MCPCADVRPEKIARGLDIPGLSNRPPSPRERVSYGAGRVAQPAEEAGCCALNCRHSARRACMCIRRAANFARCAGVNTA